MNKLVRLFFEMFKIALLVVGGGYAIIAVADDVFSRRLRWTRDGELIENLSLFQMFPGIMAGHCAVYVGRKVAGSLGSAVALSAVILPSLVIFTLVSMGYDAMPLGNRWLAAVFLGLRASLAGVIAAMIVRGWRKSVCGVYGYAMVVVAFAFLMGGVNPALVIVAAMAVGTLREFAPSPCGRSFCSLGMVVPIFLKYGLLAFGGGYVLVPMYMRDFVGPDAPHLQLSAEEFANLMALTQMTPGPIGINAATFFGFRMCGEAGAVLATVALVLPGALLLLWALASLERFRDSRVVKGLLGGVRPVTSALMLSAAMSFAGMSLWKVSENGDFSLDGVSIALAAFAFVSTVRRLMGVMQTIFVCAAVSITALVLRTVAGFLV